MSSDIEQAIDINKTLIDMMLKHSALLSVMTPPGLRPPVTDEMRWGWAYDDGIHSVVQALHDLMCEHGAYCYDY